MKLQEFFVRSCDRTSKLLWVLCIRNHFRWSLSQLPEGNGAPLVQHGKKNIAFYRALEAFATEVYQCSISLHDEIVLDCRQQLRQTGLVPEKMVMMIESDVLEPVAADQRFRWQDTFQGRLEILRLLRS